MSEPLFPELPEPDAVRETLCENEWVSLKVVRKPDAGVHGYVYSHETRCQGRIVAVLPYRETPAGREYLVKSEMTPCWGFDRVRSAVTGGWEGGDIAGDAVHEMLEETGYEITRADLIPLGESFASKSADTVYTLFSVDLTGRTPGEAMGDGTEQPNRHEWVRFGELAWVKDPQLHVMFLRLFSEPAIPVDPAVIASAARGAQSSAFPAPVTDFGHVSLELMGHRVRSGPLAEVVVAGQPFLRITDPRHGTEMYRPDAVYCLTPGPDPALAPDRVRAIPSGWDDDLDEEDREDEPF